MGRPVAAVTTGRHTGARKHHRWPCLVQRRVARGGGGGGGLPLPGRAPESPACLPACLHAYLCACLRASLRLVTDGVHVACVGRQQAAVAPAGSGGSSSSAAAAAARQQQRQRQPPVAAAEERVGVGNARGPGRQVGGKFRLTYQPPAVHVAWSCAKPKRDGVPTQTPFTHPFFL